MIVVFAPCHDEATQCSHWVAHRNCERLEAELGQVPLLLERDGARRAMLELALASEAAGLAFFGHGGEDRLFDNDGAAALDEHNLALVRDRWVHAFACRAGDHLAGPAAAAGVRCFVGYESALNIDWTPDEIPDPIRPAFIELVTQTTLELARGVSDGDALRRAALGAQATVIAWCDEHPEQAMGLEITAQQLVARLVVRPGSWRHSFTAASVAPAAAACRRAPA